MQPLILHNKVKEVVCHTISALITKEDLGEFFADGALVTNEQAQVSNEPDGTFVSWDASESERVVFVPRKDELGQFTELQDVFASHP